MLNPGDTVISLGLPRYGGGTFDLAQLAGRSYLLAFFRFASCPFCNLRVHQLIQRYEELGERFEVVAIFDDTVEALAEQAPLHAAPFPILGDPDRVAYKAYAIQRSLGGMLTGMLMRFPTLMQAMIRYGLPDLTSRAMLTMPADFLVGPDGIIQTAYYGKDEGDHLPMERVLEFADAHSTPGGVSAP